MKKNTIKLIILISAITMACNQHRREVDLIITADKIYTVDSLFGTAECFAVKNGAIVAIGTKQEILSRYHAEKTIDYGNNVIYPGFIDAHCHFLGYGLGLTQANLSGAKSWNEVVARLESHRKRYQSGWVIGRGWNQTEWDTKQFPTNELLNRIFPDQPVFLVRVDGHAAIANSKALSIAGIGTDTKISGGEVVCKEGRPTGLLIDNAMELVRKHIPEPSDKEKEQALLAAQNNCFGVGLTSIHEAGLNTDEVMLIDSLQRADKLKIRINAMLTPTRSNYEKYIAKGIYQTPRLTVRSIKTYADGALGSRGALLLQPYNDDTANRGLQVAPTSTLDSICSTAYRNGYQLCTHCIGDSAVRLMLRLYSKYLPEDNNLRWRIEHSQVVNPRDLPLYGKYRIIPSVQTTHATSDMSWAEKRLGKRIKHAYAYRELLQQNGWLPNGSDFPIEQINPLFGFYAGVARKNLNGEPANGFQTENALTRKQALKAMTIWAAKACFEENKKGSLEPGKYADFIVLNADLMEMHIDSIPRAKTIATWINGEKVFENSTISEQSLLEN